jgi:hypothetical protein
VAVTHFILSLGEVIVGFDHDEGRANELARALGATVTEADGPPPSNDELAGVCEAASDSFAEVIELRPREPAVSGFHVACRG